MRLAQYLNESNDFEGVIGKLKHFNIRQMEDFLKKQFIVFMDSINTPEIEVDVLKLINKGFGTNFHSLEEILRGRIQPLKESKMMNEDLTHWWDLVKTEAFPTLAFYPALQVWLEIDKYLKGQEINIRVTVIYAIFWVLLVSGKYVKGWLEWKKQNPQEFEQERSQGKGGII